MRRKSEKHQLEEILCLIIKFQELRIEKMYDSVEGYYVDLNEYLYFKFSAKTWQFRASWGSICNEKNESQVYTEPSTKSYFVSVNQWNVLSQYFLS